MTSITKQSKLKIGTKTDSGYDFSAKVDFKEDLGVQIERLMKEKRVNDELKLKIRKLEEEIKTLNNQNPDKDIHYYYRIGRLLLFLESKSFQEFKPYGFYRRIVEEIPQILPHVKNPKVAQKHLETMYRLAHVREDILNKASWDQWYEILKFKDLYKNRKALNKIIKLIENKKTSGPELRSIIHVLKANEK